MRCRPDPARLPLHIEFKGQQLCCRQARLHFRAASELPIFHSPEGGIALKVVVFDEIALCFPSTAWVRFAQVDAQMVGFDSTPVFPRGSGTGFLSPFHVDHAWLCAVGHDDICRAAVAGQRQLVIDAAD
jgi:hypothetical protein